MIEVSDEVGKSTFHLFAKVWNAYRLSQRRSSKSDDSSSTSSCAPRSLDKIFEHLHLSSPLLSSPNYRTGSIGRVITLWFGYWNALPDSRKALVSNKERRWI